MSKRTFLDILGLKYEIIRGNDEKMISNIDVDRSEIYLGNEISGDQFKATLFEYAIMLILTHTGYMKQQKNRKFSAAVSTLLRQYIQDNNIFQKLSVLNLCGSKYTVKYKNNKRMPDAYGEIDVVKTEIYMADYLKSDARAITFLHEMIHAVMYQLGYDKLYMDEKFVSTFSLVLFGVIKTNRKLLF